MTKPVLPEVSQALKDRAYKPSGKFPAYAPAVMLVGYLVIAAMIGAIAPYIYVLIGLLLARLGPSLLAPALGFMVGLLYLFGAGAGIGWPMWMLARKVNCRNPRLAALSGGFAGLGSAVLYYYIWAHLKLPIGYEMTGLGKLTVGATGLVLVIAGVVVPYIQVMATPFCEKCKEWYSGWVEYDLCLETSGQLIEALKQHSLQSFQYIAPNTEEEHLTVKLLHCPDCTDGDYQIEVVVHWIELGKNQKSGQQTKKQENWLTTTIPAELGKQVQEMFR